MKSRVTVTFCKVEFWHHLFHHPFMHFPRLSTRKFRTPGTCVVFSPGHIEWHMQHLRNGFSGQCFATTRRAIEEEDGVVSLDMFEPFFWVTLELFLCCLIFSRPIKQSKSINNLLLTAVHQRQWTLRNKSQNISWHGKALQIYTLKLTARLPLKNKNIPK